MLSSYLKIALRSLRRQRLYAIVNVIGLAASIAGALLIYTYISRELSWDQFHENRQGIYRVITGKIGEEDAWSGTPAPLGPVLTRTFPEIEAAARVDRVSLSVLANGRRFQEPKILAVDSAFLDVFSFPVLRSKTRNPLSGPNVIVLTESMAQKYFGDADPIGETFSINDRLTFEVTGIITDVPAASHLQFSALVPFETFYSEYLDSWGAYNFATYLLAAPGVSEAALCDKIQSYSVELEDHSQRKLDFLELQSLSDIHFQYIRGNFEPVFERKYIFVLATMALILLILGSINYVNIATAMAPARAKEVAVRKVVGSGRSALIKQFMVESYLQVLIAGIIAVLVVWLSAPYFGRVLHTDLVFDPFKGSVLAGIVAILLLIGLGSGSFSAFYISGRRPIEVLKKNVVGRQKAGFRNVLVTVQFSLSVLLIVGTFVLLQQVHFLQKADIGLDKELVVNIPLSMTGSKGQERREAMIYGTKGQELKDAFLRHASVRSASVNSYSPGEDNEHWGIEVEGRSEGLGVYIMFVDKDFFTTFDVPLVEGAENLQAFGYGADMGVLLNESARAEIGWESAAGKELSGAKVLGVVKDFNFRSLHHGIEPLMIVITQGGKHISVKITNQDIPATLAFLEETYHAFAPDTPFEYVFFDDAYQQLYESEQRSSRAVLLFTILCLVIAGVGLFGLSSFITVQRTKEIGVRKVMGASVTGIVFHLSRDFAKLVIVATLIASPIAWYVADRWLEHFANRIDLHPGIFLLAGIIALVIALLTVSTHAIRAALVNPVESLRYE